MKRRMRRPDQETELTLIPVMNLFVGLIPFLLLSTAFVKFGGIDVYAPSTSQEQLEQDSSKLSLTFKVQNKKVTVAGFKNGFDSPVKSVSASFKLKDKEAFMAHMIAVKQKFPHIATTIFYADPDSKYHEAVTALDSIRSLNLDSNIIMATGVVN